MTSDVCTAGFTTPQIVTAAGTAARVAASSAGVELGRRLLLAARAGDSAAVLELMAAGAPFSTDWLGTSALHLAAAGAHADTCAVLLRAGVSRDARTKVERTPLHLAALAGHAGVARLLLAAGAAPDARDLLRMTPLHWAAQAGHAAAAAELLRAGADPLALSKFHKSPLSLAAELGRADVRALCEDALKQREAARSVTALVNEQMEEASATEPQTNNFDTVQSAVQRIDDLKPNRPKQTERIIKTEKKTESQPGGSTAAAQLLRRHGITLLPTDDGSTVLNALQSGRTVVLSDAGKLMLKESGEASPPASASKASASGAGAGAGVGHKGMVLTASPARAPPRAGVKVFTLNNKLLAAPRGDRLPVRKVIHPQDMQVKFVQLPPDAKIISPSKLVGMKAKTRLTQASRNVTSLTTRPPVKIIMNKSNFNRLMATATRNAEHNLPEVTATNEPEIIEMTEGDVEVVGGSDSPGVLRAQLAAAQRSLAAMRRELKSTRAKLAQYERLHSL